MTLREHLRACERQYLAELLERHAGNISAVAREAKLNRTALYDKLYAMKLRQPGRRHYGNSHWQCFAMTSATDGARMWHAQAWELRLRSGVRLGCSLRIRVHAARSRGQP